MQWSDIFDVNGRVSDNITFGIMAVFLAIYLVIRYRFKGRTEETLRELSGFFGGLISDSSGDLLFDSNYAGIPFRIKLYPIGGHSFQFAPHYPLNCMEVFYNKPFPFPLFIRREGSSSRVEKSLGLTRDIQTWNPAFDSKFIISSPKENEQAVLNFFKSSEKKEAVQSIFALGFQLLKTTDDGLFVQLQSYDLWHLKPDTVGHLLRNMETFYQND